MRASDVASCAFRTYTSQTSGPPRWFPNISVNRFALCLITIGPLAWRELCQLVRASLRHHIALPGTGPHPCVMGNNGHCGTNGVSRTGRLRARSHDAGRIHCEMATQRGASMSSAKHGLTRQNSFGENLKSYRTFLIGCYPQTTKQRSS